MVFLSDTYEGKKHDKKIADEEDYEFPEGSTVWKDTGFQGFSPAGVTIKQPKKEASKRRTNSGREGGESSYIKGSS